jgi:hypothetical protein
MVSLPAGLIFAADFLVLALIPAGSRSPLEAFSCAGSRTRFVQRATDFLFDLSAKFSVAADFAVLSDSRPFSFSCAAQFPAQPIDFLPVCSVLHEAQRFPARFSSVRQFPTRCLLLHGLDSAGARPVSPQSWPHF